MLVVVIVVGSLLAKFFSGWLGGRWVGFSSKQSVLIGVSTMPQLSTTLAVASAALALGLFEDQMLAAIIALSIISTLVAPILIRRFASRAQAPLTPPMHAPE